MNNYGYSNYWDKYTEPQTSLRAKITVDSYNGVWRYKIEVLGANHGGHFGATKSGYPSKDRARTAAEMAAQGALNLAKEAIASKDGTGGEEWVVYA